MSYKNFSKSATAAGPEKSDTKPADASQKAAAPAPAKGSEKAKS